MDTGVDPLLLLVQALTRPGPPPQEGGVPQAIRVRALQAEVSKRRMVRVPAADRMQRGTIETAVRHGAQTGAEVEVVEVYIKMNGFAPLACLLPPYPVCIP